MPEFPIPPQDALHVRVFLSLINFKKNQLLNEKEDFW